MMRRESGKGGPPSGGRPGDGAVSGKDSFQGGPSAGGWLGDGAAPGKGFFRGSLQSPAGRRHGRKTGARIDYRDYRLSAGEWVSAVFQALLLCAVLDYLFYRKLWVLVFFLPLGIWYVSGYRQRKLTARQKKLTGEFRELLGCLSVSLRAGYSVENSLTEAEKDLAGMLGPDSLILEELAFMNSQIRLSVPVESLLLDLGRRSGIEDVENFAAVFVSGRKMGGNLSGIVRSASAAISDKLDVEREIEASLAAKKYEQRIMSVMPCGIILYMQLTSPGYLDVLYTTTLGMLVMTGCLAVYAAAVLWGNSIVQIEV